jgi:hypothetical protein
VGEDSSCVVFRLYRKFILLASSGAERTKTISSGGPLGTLIQWSTDLLNGDRTAFFVTINMCVAFSISESKENGGAEFNVQSN